MGFRVQGVAFGILGYRDVTACCCLRFSGSVNKIVCVCVWHSCFLCEA